MTHNTASTASPLLQLHEAVKGLQVAMLTTVSANGLLNSKPMHLLTQDDEGQFWFYCQDPARTADALPGAAHDSAFQRANLAFSDESSSRYVSVACRGEIVRDRSRIQALWSVTAKPWFPEGPDSPDLVCLKMVPLQAELWRGPGHGLTQALAMAASVVTGRPVGMGEHVLLDALQPGGTGLAPAP